MDDYIFLIIAVVISIFAAIKKGKKKEDVELPNGIKQERPRNSFMDQLLGEDFLEEPEQEIAPQVIRKPFLTKVPLVASSKLRAPINYQPAFRSNLPDRTGNSLHLTVNKQADELRGDEAFEEYESGYIDDFSLRKAFVYSEIMNRKYT